MCLKFAFGYARISYKTLYFFLFLLYRSFCTHNINIFSFRLGYFSVLFSSSSVFNSFFLSLSVGFHFPFFPSYSIYFIFLSLLCITRTRDQCKQNNLYVPYLPKV
uniref:Uncharacterized protein n=1 Tax=Cacopsylla melanoneura TaxID=428564 RepID=A0A8D9F8I1_9HEMI